MDSTIKIQLPKTAMKVQTTTIGDEIISRITIHIKSSDSESIGIVIDCCWFSVAAWERDMRSCLERLVKDRDAIVESRTVNTGATATEQRLQEVLSQILIDEAGDE